MRRRSDGPRLLPILFVFLSLVTLPWTMTCGAESDEASTPEGSRWRHEFTADSPMHPIQKEMKAYVEDMLEHAIDGYLTYAFPKDDLESLSGTGRDGMGGLSVTLIDSLDTVALMHRPKLFRRLARWVEANVTFDKNITVSGFETNIRVLGGLLGAHFMYEEGIVPVVPEEHDYDGGLLRLAVDLGNRLLPGFDTPTGIPFGSLNLRHGVASDETLSSAAASGGTYLLEFIVLSRVTGDARYEAAARRASQAVYDLRHQFSDLIGNHVNVGTGQWVVPWASVGTGADSTIEYWLKGHALSGEASEWERFARTSRAASNFFREGGFYLQKMYDDPSFIVPGSFHCSLASFYPGCLAHAGRLKEATEAAWSAHALFRYLGALPEQFPLSEPHLSLHDSFPLRPEHLESIYHLYRATGDPAYLKMGREFAIAVNLRTRTPYGFAELKPVEFPHSRAHLKNRMESFMISETLKYLYLLFDECNPIHMPQRRHHYGGPPARKTCHEDAELLERTSSRNTLVGWEFTTEAHLVPNHAEWLVPTSAMADRRAMPPGLLGSRREPMHEQHTSLFGQATARLRDLAGADPFQLPVDESSILAASRAAMQAGAGNRTASFLDSPHEARRKAVWGLSTALAFELQPERVDMREPQRSLWRDVSAKHLYYCQGHPITGLDRLSKSVYREMAPAREY